MFRPPISSRLIRVIVSGFCWSRILAIAGWNEYDAVDAPNTGFVEIPDGIDQEREQRVIDSNALVKRKDDPLRKGYKGKEEDVDLESSQQIDHARDVIPVEMGEHHKV